MKKQILLPVSPAELLDKIAILEIKEERIKDPSKLPNIKIELAMLRKVASECIEKIPELDPLIKELKKVNERGWEIEDSKREAERKGDFGEHFIKEARSAYKNNDRRAAIWKEINLLLDSNIVQEKSYQKY